MSTDRDVTGIVRSWLEEGRTALPDRVLDAVLDQLPATRQRLAPWRARRFDQMSSTTRLLATIAAAIVVAAVGFSIAVRPSGSPLAMATPSPSPSTTAPALMSGALPGQDLPPGTYLIDRPFPVRATLTVPKGWTPYTVDQRTAGILVNHAKPPNGSGWGLSFLAGPYVIADPCRPAAGTLPEGTLSSAAKILAVLRAMPGVDAVGTATTVDGRPATLVTLTAHSDTATCAKTGAAIWRFSDGTDYTVSPGQIVVLRVLDVDGLPIMILTTDFPELSHWETTIGGATPNPTAHAADLPELRAILDSIRIEGRSAVPSGGPSAAAP